MRQTIQQGSCKSFTACSGSDEGDKEMELDEKKSILLHHWLAEPLPREPAWDPKDNRSQSQMTHSIWALAGKPLGKLMLESKTEITLLRKIKDHGRMLSESATSEVEHDVANTVYYTAIASALALHETKITGFSYSELSHFSGG